MKAEELYVKYKTLLFSLAYRMLGSVMDAEDIVQEAFIALNGAAPEHVRSQKSYLCKIVTNRCLDRLRSASKQREVYIGPWLPEPVVGGEEPDGDPVRRYLRKESVSTAYLLLLQQLTSVERAVFLLREVMQYEYDEIAEIVGKSSTNCRQIFHRAKRGLARTDEADSPRIREQAAGLVEKFVSALAAGDVGMMMQVLAADATLYSDGGGKVTAAVHPILGAERVIRFMAGILAKAPDDFSFRLTEVNGLLGIVTYAGGQPAGVLSFGTERERIMAVYIVVNPDKLSHVR
ncbi:RNA polymerase sigma-70 factor [Paenibacillus sp. MBLB4367]|uniref:RNA polymerase sigma-70 factor n=1 Tax=Paenibacillus sp. MBLB4367 TaxID=3384767 RepID=UPI0039082EEA